MLNEIMELVLKLEENVTYAIPTSSKCPYKFFHQDQPVVVNIVHSNPAQADCNALSVGSWDTLHKTWSNIVPTYKEGEAAPHTC